MYKWFSLQGKVLKDSLCAMNQIKELKWIFISTLIIQISEVLSLPIPYA
jgi:hypothetical protein